MKFMRVFFAAAAAIGFMALTGCASTQMALEHKDLDVQSYLGHDIMLPMTSAADKTFALAVRNSTTVPLDMSRIQARIAEGLTARGYRQVDPGQAHFQVQLSVYSSYNSAQAAGSRNGGGVLLGGAAGGYNGNMQGALIGAVVGGIADTVAGSLVKNVTVNIKSHVQIAVRQSHAVQVAQDTSLSQGTSTTQTQREVGVSDMVTYQTDVITSANQVNMHVQDAIPQIEAGMVRNVVGLF